MKPWFKSSLLLALACIGSGAGHVARAGIISFSDSVADYSGPEAVSGFPIDHGIIATFSFASGNALGATISGTWGNSDYSFSTAGADVFIDGLLVARCIEFDDCWLDATGTQPWSYTFSAADLLTGILDDGMAMMQVVQTSSTFVRLGALSLSGEIIVTEPALLALFGAGLLGLGLQIRYRRHSKAG